jgi:menaquinol-cytochrome c reductase iron-sulfur subunit
MLMTWALRTIGLLTAGMLAIPSLTVAFAPIGRHRQRKQRWHPLGPVDEFPVGEMRKVTIPVVHEDRSRALAEKAVYAWRPAANAAEVYSRSCTDLGCPVTWDPGSQCFFCPCHGGIFAKNGQRMAGPPHRPLYRYASRIRRGRIEIDLNSLPPLA